MTVAATAPVPVVSTAGVAKSFGATSVLTDITVDVPTGITGLLGSNGAGKTTLLSMVLGIEPRDGGVMTVLGHDPATAGPEVRARIGYSPEHHHLPDDVQAADLVRHLAQLHGLPFAASTERASDALWLVGLGEERFRPIGTMSTGQRQRVKLAAAIAHDPALVLLDEPTDGLDPVQRDAMLELIHRIGTEYGISILLSSHLLEEVERICDHVVIIADGTVRRAGNLDEMRGARAGVVVELEDGHDEVVQQLQALGLFVRTRAWPIVRFGRDGFGRSLLRSRPGARRRCRNRCRAAAAQRPDDVARRRLLAGSRDVSTQGTQIHDLGYRAYTGERAGVAWAVRSLAVHSMRRALGLKRSARHKIAPLLSIAIAYVPAIALAGFAAFLGGDIIEELIGFGEYFGITSFSLFLFAAAVAPGVLTTDRTSGMLALYLASPLTRTTYVLAKAIGIFLVMLIVAAGPILFLILGYWLAGAGPDGVVATLEVLVRALFAGALTAALYTGVSMFISSIPRRWAIATLAIVGFFIVSSILAVGLTESTDAPELLVLASPDDVMTKASQHIMDDVTFTVDALDGRSGWLLVLVSAAYGIVALAATWWRYQTIEVER